MRTHLLEREQLVERPLADVFDFLAQPRNLEAITPPWLRFAVLTPEPIAMGPGTLVRDRVHYALPLGVFGAVARLAVVRRDLERIFDYRRQAIARALSPAPG